MRRFGFGSNPAGYPVAARCASAPVNTSASGPTNTAEDSNGEESNNSGRTCPSGRPSTATVFDVPKSTPSR
jgi:hypothetical protein